MSHSKQEDSLLSKIQDAEQALAEVKSFYQANNSSSKATHLFSTPINEDKVEVEHKANYAGDSSAEADFFAEDEELSALFAGFAQELEAIKAELSEAELAEASRLSSASIDADSDLSSSVNVDLDSDTNSPSSLSTSYSSTEPSVTEILAVIKNPKSLESRREDSLAESSGLNRSTGFARSIKSATSIASATSDKSDRLEKKSATSEPATASGASLSKSHESSSSLSSLAPNSNSSLDTSSTTTRAKTKAERVEEIRAEVAKIRAQSSQGTSLKALREAQVKAKANTSPANPSFTVASTDITRDSENTQDPQGSTSRTSYSRRKSSYQDALKAALEYKAQQAKKAEQVDKEGKADQVNQVDQANSIELAKPEEQDNITKADANVDAKVDNQEDQLGTKKDDKEEASKSMVIEDSNTIASDTKKVSDSKKSSDTKKTSDTKKESVTKKVDDTSPKRLSIDDSGFEEVESEVDYFAFANDEEAEQHFNQQMAQGREQAQAEALASEANGKADSKSGSKGSYLGISKKTKLSYLALAFLVAIGFNLYGYFTEEHNEEEGYETLFTYFFKSKKESPLANLSFTTLEDNLAQKQTIVVHSPQDLVQYCFFSAVQRSDYLPSVVLNKKAGETPAQQKTLHLVNAHEGALSIDKVITNFSKAGLAGDSLEFIYQRVFANAALLFTLPYQEDGKVQTSLKGEVLNSPAGIARQEALDSYLRLNFGDQKAVFYGLVSYPDLGGLNQQPERETLTRGKVSFSYQGTEDLPLVEVANQSSASQLYYYKIANPIEGLTLKLARSKALSSLQLSQGEEVEFGAGVFNTSDNSCTIIEKVELK